MSQRGGIRLDLCAKACGVLKQNQNGKSANLTGEGVAKSKLIPAIRIVKTQSLVIVG
jgi:hypothetical protein